MAESKEELKNLLMKLKEESEKAGLKLNIQKMKIMSSGPIQFSSVQSLSHVRLLAIPCIAARQASLSITISRSSLRLTFIDSVMPSNQSILKEISPGLSLEEMMVKLKLQYFGHLM